MNPYVAFSLKSFGAFIGGLSLNVSGHALVLKTPTDWFILILSGFAAMVAYQGGVISANPFARVNKNGTDLITDPSKDRIE